MQSQSQVQQVWDSLVLHLKSLSDGLQLAHEVFTQPEEEVKVSPHVSYGSRPRLQPVAPGLHCTEPYMPFCLPLQGMSCTTLRRRRQKSLDNLSKGKDNVDLLLMHASQVFSATSHWQAQVDAAESARQAATNMLEGIGQQLQVTDCVPALPCTAYSCISALCKRFVPYCTLISTTDDERIPMASLWTAQPCTMQAATACQHFQHITQSILSTAYDKQLCGAGKLVEAKQARVRPSALASRHRLGKKAGTSFASCYAC